MAVGFHCCIYPSLTVWSHQSGQSQCDWLWRRCRQNWVCHYWHSTAVRTFCETLHTYSTCLFTSKGRHDPTECLACVRQNFGKVTLLWSEVVTVELSKSYCLPFLTYGFEAVTLSSTNARMLDVCLNRAIYRMFGVGFSDNIADMRNLLGLHSISSLINDSRISFMNGLLDTASSALMSTYSLNCLT